MTKLRTILLLLCSFTMSLRTFSQNVTITPDGITPALSGSYQRLTYDAIVALPTPDDGDIAYDVTFKCMRLYNGTKWVRLVSDNDLNLPSVTGWSAGGSGDDGGLGIATDTSGNVFVSGYFQGAVSFGDTNVTSAGGKDIFVAKYTNTGTLLWVQTAGGTAEDGSRNLAVDISGNVYVIGTFQSTATFKTTTITSAGANDIFIAKYNKNGGFIWVQKGGGPEEETIDHIRVDSDGNVYSGGSFTGVATFGGSTITSAGNVDVFIVKYNTSGTLQWLQRTGGVNIDVGLGIAVDNSGFVYITGYAFGATTIGNMYFAGSGGSDVFITKYNPFTSSWEWTINGINTNDDAGWAITTDNSGNIYLTGYFGGSLNLNSTILNSDGYYDTWIAKFTTNGILEWLKKAGGIGNDTGIDLVVDTDKNVYVTGYFRETATFGNISITSAGLEDTYIAKYNSAGVIQWVQRLGNTNIDQGIDLALDTKNNVYMTGHFNYSVKFGNASLTSAGTTDIFVARIKE